MPNDSLEKGLHHAHLYGNGCTVCDSQLHWVLALVLSLVLVGGTLRGSLDAKIDGYQQAPLPKQQLLCLLL